MIDCDPQLNDAKELLIELNKSNGLYKFIRTMREKFLEVVARGMPLCLACFFVLLPIASFSSFFLKKIIYIASCVRHSRVIDVVCRLTSIIGVFSPFIQMLLLFLNLDIFDKLLFKGMFYVVPSRINITRPRCFYGLYASPDVVHLN